MPNLPCNARLDASPCNARLDPSTVPQPLGVAERQMEAGAGYEAIGSSDYVSRPSPLGVCTS